MRSHTWTRAIALALLAWAGATLPAGRALAQPAATAATGAERPLALADAIALALAKNEHIQIQREALAAADATAKGAHGAYDPVLRLDGGWARVNEPVNSAFSGAPADELAPTNEQARAGATVEQLLPTGGVLSVRAAGARSTTDGSFDLLTPAYDTQVGVELRQPLLRNRSLDGARFAIRVTAADRRQATAALRRELNETVAAVEQAYWTLVAARREVEVRDESVRLAQEQLEQTRIRIESGAVSETELAQPRAELERRRGDLFDAREALSRAQNDLKLLILGDADLELWSAQLAPVDEVETPLVTVDADNAIAQGLAGRPEVQVAAAAIVRRQAEAAFARNQTQPALDAVVAYDRFGLAGRRNPAGASLPGLPSDIPPALDGSWGTSWDRLADGDFDDVSAALVFSYPIGNRAARNAAAAARHGERQAEADLVHVRKAVRAEVLDAVAALETAAQRIEAARAGLEAADTQLSAERDRYAAGLSTNFLVLTRQNDLSRARLDQISALTDYRAAGVELARATGALLQQRHIDLDESTQ